MRYFAIVIYLFLVVSCQNSQEELTVQSIIDKAIKNACRGNCERANIDFVFRNRRYVSRRFGPQYQLERITSDGKGKTRDVLSNNGFQRYRNDTLLVIPDSMAIKYSNSVNSVHYFAQLPYGLNAPAARKELVGSVIIKGEPYFKIRVSFSELGGGKDYEDVFIYWIHEETYYVDYLAYSYITDGGGIRFREAYNPRVLSGIRFVDYKNFKPTTDRVELLQMDQLYEADKLVLLSKIETEAISVKLLTND